MRLIRNTLLALLLLPGLAFGSDLSNYVEIGNWTNLNNTTEVGNATEIGPFISVANLLDGISIGAYQYPKLADNRSVPAPETYSLPSPTSNTYYVRQDGTAPNTGAAVGPSSDASKCMSPAVFNASVFSAGDFVYISGAGGNITTGLSPNSGGSDASNRIYYVADPASAPTINGGGTVVSGFEVANINHVVVQGLTITNTTTDGLIVSGTSTGVVVSDVTATSTGNQGFQVSGTASVTYYNISASGNTDDGFSMHDSTTAVIHTGEFTGNDQNINIISDADLTAYDITAGTAGTYDIYLTAGVSGPTATINGFTTTGVVQVNDGEITLESGNASGILRAQTAGTLNINKSNITAPTEPTSGGVVNVDACTLSGVTIDHTIDYSIGSSGQVTNSVFYGIGSAKFGVAIRSGATVSVLNNTFYDAGKVGKGMFIDGTATVKNNIFNNLAAGVHALAGATLTIDHNAYYENTTDFPGVDASSASDVTTDPLLTSPTTDFSLQAASPCINAGVDVSLRTDYTGTTFVLAGD